MTVSHPYQNNYVFFSICMSLFIAPCPRFYLLPRSDKTLAIRVLRNDDRTMPHSKKFDRIKFF
jgi:hypothetical protein